MYDVFSVTVTQFTLTTKPYSARAEWADIAPIPQQDGPSPVCAIKYSDRCEFIFIGFRLFLTF